MSVTMFVNIGKLIFLIDEPPSFVSSFLSPSLLAPSFSAPSFLMTTFSSLGMVLTLSKPASSGIALSANFSTEDTGENAVNTGLMDDGLYGGLGVDTD